MKRELRAPLVCAMAPLALFVVLCSFARPEPRFRSLRTERAQRSDHQHALGFRQPAQALRAFLDVAVLEDALVTDRDAPWQLVWPQAQIERHSVGLRAIPQHERRVGGQGVELRADLVRECEHVAIRGSVCADGLDRNDERREDECDSPQVTPAHVAREHESTRESD